MKKRVISVLMVVLMVVLTMIPQNVYAENNVPQAVIQYLAVEKAKVDLEEEQNIVVGFDGDISNVQEAQLMVRNITNGTDSIVQLSENEEDAMKFSILYSSQDQVGEYVVKQLIYSIGGEATTIDVSNIGIEARYGVEMDVETAPDAVATESGDEQTASDNIDIEVSNIEEDGTMVEATSISEAIQYAADDGVAAQDLDNNTRSVESNVVVVLDPGHDNTHAGARGNGLCEEQLTLKIAQYCRQELETYKGVTVYMTRGDDGACPYPGTTSGVCNQNRVSFAQSVGASVYVSIHLNSASSADANGVEIYYPNQNYSAWASAVGQFVASDILTQLTALGLNNRGLKIRNSTDGETYPDGSLTDYYGVIRNGKLAGFSSIIVEHAFLTGNVDAARYLSNEDGLKSLGVADATGIANAYNLQKKTEWTATGLYLVNHSHDNFTVGMVTENSQNTPIEYRWLVYDINAEIWSCVQDWNRSEWLSWNPGKSGKYLIRGEVREIGNHEKAYDFTIGSEHQQYIKGKCQMPYTGSGGGYLIGIESFENPNQSYQYEMQIMDCTLYAQGKPAWIYTTGKNKVSDGNAMWTIWQPQYGYYWTLFRVYDANGNLLDEECYGFENIC